MDTLILEDFRCFAGRHEVPIRPLTLLVGENSTGKTSFLAGVRAAHALRDGEVPDFNEEPFRLGSYDQIANYRGGRAGRAKSFAVGQAFTFSGGRDPFSAVRLPTQEIQIETRIASQRGQLVVSEFVIRSKEHTLEIANLERDLPTVVFSAQGRVVFRREVGQERSNIRRHLLDDLGLKIQRVAHEAREASGSSTNDEEAEYFDRLIAVTRFRPGARSYALAPIRTSPRRTYDPTAQVRSPEGSHVPMMLERLLGNGSGSSFGEQLEDFGQASSLYSNLGVRRFGRKGSDPFQIEVRPSRGRMARNLIDVGYGVSQAIPIVADCISAERGSTLLVQQPEVHLHPRAQAAMGSFFRQLAASGRNPLVVETHSDHLVDRIRMDVRDERIKASDVMILYFEQGRRGVDIHPIELDAAGRVVDVPEGYRSFFLEEDRRFFGVGQ